MRRYALLFTALLLAGCASSPKTNYFTLSVQPEHSPQSILEFPVQLAAVHIPPTLDRMQMVRGTGPNSVAISGTDRWTAPLGDMIRNVLARDLVARVQGDRIVLPRAPTPDDARTIVVSLTSFGPDKGGEVRLEGSWTLVNGADKPVLRRAIALKRAEPNTKGAQMAAAMSNLLGQLAARMADTLAHEAAEAINPVSK